MRSLLSITITGASNSPYVLAYGTKTVKHIGSKISLGIKSCRDFR